MLILTNKTRKKIRQFQQFVLNRKSENIRNELYESIAIHCVYDHGNENGSLAYDAISYHIEKDHHLSIPKLHLDNALERLITQGILSKKDQILTLTKNKNDEIKKDDEEYNTLREDVLNDLDIRIKEKLHSLPEQQIRLIITNFEELLKDTFIRYGVQIARIFASSSEKISELKGYAGFQDQYQKTIVQIIPEELRSDLDKILNNFFFKPSDKLSKFCFSLVQSYVLIEILNVDPELKRLQEIEWKRKKIYLDTNIIISLMFEGSDLHESIETIVKQTSSLGAQLVISEHTANEFAKWLDDCTKSRSKIKTGIRISSALKDIDHDDLFLKTYGLQAQKFTAFPIEAFAKKFENFEMLLDNKYGIKLDNEQIKEFQETDESQKLQSKILQLSAKSDAVAKHDMKMILKIHELRKEGNGGLTGVDTWFLTNDHTLPIVEREVYGERRIPASVTSEIWMQIVSTFISPTITIKDTGIAFSKLLSSNFTSHKVNADDLLDLINVFMDDVDFTIEQFEIIIGDNFIREKLKEFKGTIDKKEELTLENVKPFVSRVQKLVSEDYTMKIKNVEEESNRKVKQLESKIQELDLKLSDQVKKIKELHWITKLKLIIIGLVAGFTILDVLAYINYFKDFNSNFFALIGIQIAIIFGIPTLLNFFHKKHE